MKQRVTRDWQRALYRELSWFVGLRWVAGAAVVAGWLFAGPWLGPTWRPQVMGWVGLAILSYNAAIWPLLRRVGDGTRRGGAAGADGGGAGGPRVEAEGLKARTRSRLLLLGWAQLLADLICLSILMAASGGLYSPLLGFFVFHMVFASLLLPRLMAYAAGTVAMTAASAALLVSGQWPATLQQRLVMIGWMVTLLGTAWLANGIVSGVRAQRRRVERKNRRIAAMTRKLRRQARGMIQHEKMAAAGRMAAGVAHEIANPLASMDALLQAIERRPEKLRPEAVETLREQVTRIHKVLRQMTAFAHPGDGQWVTGSINDVAGRALEVTRFDPRAKRAAVERELGEDLPPVRMMPDALQQVLINLIINALDAMEGAEAPKLTVRTGHAGGSVRVDVIDNGHGIPPRHRRRLFEPFFTTKPVGKGTGLGLSISYNLVRQHGGDIQVESREGAGTRFTITLPAAAAASEGGAAPPPPAAHARV